MISEVKKICKQKSGRVTAALAGTQETMGGAGVERSGTESSGRVSPFLLQVSNTSTTKEGDLKSS